MREIGRWGAARPLFMVVSFHGPHLPADTKLHDLRHTCATLLLTRGVHRKIVSEMLGHWSIAIKLDIYSRVIPGLGDAATGVMETLSH